MGVQLGINTQTQAQTLTWLCLFITLTSGSPSDAAGAEGRASFSAPWTAARSSRGSVNTHLCGYKNNDSTALLFMYACLYGCFLCIYFSPTKTLSECYPMQKNVHYTVGFLAGGKVYCFFVFFNLHASFALETSARWWNLIGNIINKIK